MSPVSSSGRLVRRVSFVLPFVAVAACTLFPAPIPPAPLTKSEVSGVAKCQKAVHKAQLAFVKTKTAALESCVNGVLALRLPFESGLIPVEDFEAGLVKQRAKCTKSFAKVTAASTKFVDAIIKACTPVEGLVVGPYDGLRFQAEFGQLSSGGSAADVPALAGALCALTEMGVDAQVWIASPRLIELLLYLGPEYVSEVDSDSAFPNIPLDPRCPPVSGGPPIFSTPTPIPTSTP